MQYLMDKSPYAGELKLFIKRDDKSEWINYYRYSRFGACFRYTNFGNNAVLGSEYAFYGFIQNPVTRPIKKYLNLGYEVGFGISYLNKKFDIEENPLNIAIGSHFNAFIDFGIFNEIILGKKYSIVQYAKFNHCSNGRIKLPNLGINFANVGLGIRYRFIENVKSLPDPIPEKISDSIKRFGFQINIGGAVKREGNFNLNNYFAGSISLNAGYISNIKTRNGIGFDLFYDSSIHESMLNDGISETNEIDLYKVGGYLFHDVTYKRLTATIQFGYYIFSPYKASAIYERLGLRYKIINNLHLSLCIKAHYAEADFLECGIGYSLNL